MNERLIAANLLKQDEGVRQFVYQDSMGYWTIATGRCVDQRKGRGLSPDEVDLMLQNDITTNIAAATKEIPSYPILSDNRKAVLISMYHQIGGLSGWPNFRKSIEAKDWSGAKANMLASLWAKQTPQRAKRLADMFYKG